MAPGLKKLKLRGELKQSDLPKLQNLGFLRLDDWNGSDLVEILQQNSAHLKELQVVFDEYALLRNKSLPQFSFCPLTKLKILHLHDVNRRLELKPSDFPSLEELRVSFDSKLGGSHTRYMTLSILKFVKLKTLFVNYLSLEDMLPFKNLKSLGLYDYPDELELVDVVQHLPSLSTLKWDGTIDSETELELCQFLIAENRTLNINDDMMP